MTFLVVPEPENANPGVGVIVHAPDGKPVNWMIPLALQVGCVTVPIVGGAGFVPVTVALVEGGEVQPSALVTVKVYVPDPKFITV